MGNPNPVIQVETQFKKGNTANLIHGGGAAEARIQRGEPLTGPAREAELAVYEELAMTGRAAVVKRNAARLQAAADLYWSAISKLMAIVEEEGQPANHYIKKLDGYIARFGWLAGASLRAWAQVKEEEPDGGVVVDYEELLERETD